MSKSKIFKDQISRLQEERDKIKEDYLNEKIKCQQFVDKIKKLEEKLGTPLIFQYYIDQEKELNRISQSKDQQISELERALKLNTNHHQKQISKINHDSKVEINKVIADKSSQIAFLRQKLSQTVNELQNEITAREEVIKFEVTKIQKQRDDDLKNFIESKEELERKMHLDQEVGY